MKIFLLYFTTVIVTSFSVHSLSTLLQYNILRDLQTTHLKKKFCIIILYMYVLELCTIGMRIPLLPVRVQIWRSGRTFVNVWAPQVKPTTGKQSLNQRSKRQRICIGIMFSVFIHINVLQLLLSQSNNIDIFLGYEVQKVNPLAFLFCKCPSFC